MSYAPKPRHVPMRQDAGLALGLLGAALFVTALIGQGASATMLGIISFCILLMTLVTGGLFLIEGRLDERKRGSMQVFCLPAIAILGFSEALFLTAGFWSPAVLVLAVAFAFAAYRRFAREGSFNLIPAAAMDVGVLGGVGATLAGFTLFAAGIISA